MAQGWKLTWTRLESLHVAVLTKACTAAIRLAAGMEEALSLVQCLKKVFKSSTRLGWLCIAPAPALKGCTRARLSLGLNWG